jgi:RNA polymerase sigma factor (TIGR02999 family)
MADQLASDPGSPVDEIVPLVYEELRRIAHRQLAAEPSGHTLSTTAVVHEAYLRLARQRGGEWVERSRFFAVAARMMRRVLIDYARRHAAVRRGRGAPAHVSLTALDEADSPAIAAGERSDSLLALDEALGRPDACDGATGQRIK